MDDMAAGDMAELVRYDALHLVGGLGGGDQAGKNIDNLAAGDEGVDVVAVEQDDLDVVGLKSGGLLEGPGHVAEERLRLGVAQPGLRHRGLDDPREAQGPQHEQPAKEIAPLAQRLGRVSHGSTYPHPPPNPKSNT